jgi:Methyltransferase domain
MPIVAVIVIVFLFILTSSAAAFVTDSDTTTTTTTATIYKLYPLVLLLDFLVYFLTMKIDTRRRGASGSGGTSVASATSPSNNNHMKGHQQQPKSYTLGVLICSNLLVLQLTSMYWWTDGFAGGGTYSGALDGIGSTTGSVGMHLTHPMNVPQGKAVALPSIQVKETENAAGNDGANAGYYGGKGDKPHLGGFANGGIDFSGVSPAAWKLMVEQHGIHSLLDVGCGRGISTSWFVDHGVDAQCVEGSHDAVNQNFLQKDHTELITEHDFSRGPWWPTETVDAVWSVEVLEHVSRNFHQNLIPAFRKAGT